jgi:exodeoxyribonuclease-3
MRLVNWNIRHGGSKLKLPAIVQAILAAKGDILVITEFQTKSADFIQSQLQAAGYSYQLSSNPPIKTNGILIASRFPVALLPQQYQPNNPYRWLEVGLPEQNLTVLGLHIPEWGSKWDKATFWQEVNRYAKDRLKTQAILIGDFNTGLELDTTGEEFACPEYMEELVQMGWVDAWRSLHADTREYTWQSPRRWFSMRLDYVFLSPTLASRLMAAQYNHSVRLQDKLSDHSMLIVDIQDLE